VMPRDEEFQLLDPAAPRHVTLPEDLQRRRLLIVGDIHGCADEFRELLAAERRPQDVVILVGDLVNKGPKSPEVIPLARELGCWAVAGNHELACLRGRAARQREGASVAPNYEWTDQMSEKDVGYIRRLPYTISLPLHGAMVVHAGLVPGVALEAQRPRDMVAMRNVAETDGVFRAFETVSQPSAARRHRDVGVMSCRRVRGRTMHHSSPRVRGHSSRGRSAGGARLMCTSATTPSASCSCGRAPPGWTRAVCTAALSRRRYWSSASHPGSSVWPRAAPTLFQAARQAAAAAAAGRRG
jgi:hypothetical protein